MPPSCPKRRRRPPAADGARGSARGTLAGDQRELGGPIQALDPRLLAQRGRRSAHRPPRDELDRAGGWPCSGWPCRRGGAPGVAARRCSSPCRASRRRSAACRPRRRPSPIDTPRARAMPARRSARRSARGARDAAACGSGASLTGAACIVRSRTSRQESPSLSSAGRPMIERGRELDGLQHDAVGDRVGRRDVVGAGEHGDAGGLEDADVGGRRGHDAVTLTANSTPAARRRRPARPSPKAISSSQQDSHCSAQAASCATVASAGAARVREHAQRRRAGAQRAARGASSSARRRLARDRAAGGTSTRREPRAATSASERRERDEQQRAVVAVEHVARSTASRRRGSPSASRLSSVCETIVPSTTGSVSRARPRRRATISAREGSPRRAGSVADISTPMNVPCIASRRFARAPGRRGGEDRVPGERARRTSRRTSARARRGPGRAWRRAARRARA